MSITLPVSALNAPVTAVTTSNQFSVAQGDLVAYQYAQTSGVPTIKLNIGSACK